MNNWIFPMAGKGQRLKKIFKFKQLIMINEKPAIYWFLLGLKKHFKNDDNLFFIAVQENIVEFQLEEIIINIMTELNINSKFTVISIPEILNGPALTIKKVEEYITPNQNCFVANTDQFTLFDLPNEFNIEEGIIWTMLSNDNDKSYVKLDEDSYVSDISEKKSISSLASTGLYYFPKSQYLFDAISSITEDNRSNKELFISHAIKTLLDADGLNLRFSTISVKLKFDLGNESGIMHFKEFIDLILKKGNYEIKPNQI